MKTLIIIPAHNEEKSITSVLNRIGKEGKILVVDDASTDRTAAIARKGKARLIVHKTNRGKGSSLREGFSYAVLKGYEAVVTMDADGEHDPRHIPEFKDAVKRHDLVIGRRTAYRSASRLLFNAWNELWTGMAVPGIRDAQCGYRAIRVDLLKRMRLKSQGFEIELEVLLEARRLGARISNIQIATEPRKGSQVGFLDHIRINNLFDRWILENYKYLGFRPHLQLLLVGAAAIGLMVGSTIERLSG